MNDNKCLICEKEFKNSKGRNTHIRFKHPEVTIEQYYYKYYPKYCRRCKKLISFKKNNYSQSKYCSTTCMGKDFSERQDFKERGVEKKYKEEFLLQLLKDLHKKYKGYVTQKMVKENTPINHHIYHTYFGSFTNACKLANVPNLGQFNPRKHFKEDIIKKIKELYDKKKQKITRQLIIENTNITTNSIYSFFKSMGELCEQANVPYHLEDKIKEKQVKNMTKIIIDSNEKKPYNFKNCVFKRLNFGDYKSHDFYNGVVFERKSCNDLKSTMSGGNNTKRFAKEMERARKENAYILIIIDCSKKDFFETKPHGKVTNNGIYHNIKMFGSVYADVCQFVFTGSRHHSKKIVEMYHNCSPDDLKYFDFQDLVDSVDNPLYDIFSKEYIYNKIK